MSRIYSVSPSPKKGHGKVAKKGHFLTCDSMSKGHFQRATASKRALLNGIWHARRAYLCTVIKFNIFYIFSIISNLLSSLNYNILSSFSIFQDSLLPETTFPSVSHYFNTKLTIRFMIYFEKLTIEN